MELLSIDNSYEETVLSKHFRKNGFPTQNICPIPLTNLKFEGMFGKLVWIATKRALDYSFVVANNAPARYLNWGKGNPPGRVYGDCVVTWKGAMYRHDCAKQANFVCELPE
jgi:hypothetical protein